MLKLNLRAVAAAMLAGSLAGATVNPVDSIAAPVSPHASGIVVQTGDTQGEIRVISGDNQSWTQIKPGFGFVTFPVQLAANALPGGWALNRVWVVQGNSLDISQALYDSGSNTGDMEHTHSGDLTGGALNLMPEERNQIVASCNANLDPSTQQQPEHEEEAQIPLTLVMQTVNPGGGAVSEGLDWHEDTATTHFPVKVICEPFTRTMGGPSPEVQIDPDGAKIVQVELGLSTNGNAVVGGPLEYTGSCPMGITLNMRWVTNIGGGLKSYIKHKDLAGTHNWTSPEFSVTTNEPAYGGNWKKEMTDFIAIPFAGSTPSNGPGGANANNQPGGGLMFNPGGGSGGLNPATSVGATNTGTNNGLTQYIGYFKLVAYKNKQVITLPALGGGTQDVTVYDAYKSSDWRKYIVTCEPQQSTVALDAPKGLVNPPKTGVFNPDDNPFPRPAPKVDTAFDPATQDLTGPTVHKPRPPRDIVQKHSAGYVKNDDVPDRIKKLAAEARRKQAAGLKARKMKLQADTASKRRQALIAAQEAAERQRILDAANKARMLKLQQDAARRAALKSRQVLIRKRAPMLLAPKRTTPTTAPVINRRVMRVR